MKKSISISNKGITLLLLLLSLSLLSCEDVINADTDTGETKIVIDAEILWQKGTDGALQTIKISRMTAYYNPETPKVSGAQVYIENSTGTQFAFSETAPGVYTCTDFVPVLNETYTLYTSVDGKVYTATETMVPVSEINTTKQTQTGGFSGDEPEVAIYFSDPASLANYYLVSYISPTRPYPEYDLGDDELTDGNEMKSDFSDEDLKPGDTLDITLRGISHQFYNYMNLILSATDSNPFSTPPANIKGNILNKESNGDPALGYFRLCEADHRQYTLE